MKQITRTSLLFPSLMAVLLLSACAESKNSCPQASGTPAFLSVPPDALPTPEAGLANPAIQMEILGRMVEINKVVEGALCNDTWSGTVYVTCNVQVYPWQETPTFLKDCNLQIEPGTVVYVAYHNDTAYYNGCSCHTGEIAEP